MSFFAGRGYFQVCAEIIGWKFPYLLYFFAATVKFLTQTDSSLIDGRHVSFFAGCGYNCYDAAKK
jgi:hypothetical protein